MTRKTAITAEAWDRDRDPRAAPMCGFPFPHRSLAEIQVRPPYYAEDDREKAEKRHA